MEINLIRHLAWSFQKTTGLEFDELFQEAAVAYIESELKFNPEQGVKFTTFAYAVIKNHLLDYIHKTRSGPKTTTNTDILAHIITDGHGPAVEFLNELRSMPREAQFVCRLIFESPAEYLEYPPKLARGLLKRQLRDAGWTWESIWSSFEAIRNVVGETK